jgi:hypothetical protein
MSIQHSETIGHLAKALAAAQKGIKVAQKDATNPHFRSRYSDLQSIDEAARPHLCANGIAVTQGVGAGDGQAWCQTMLVHADTGEWVSCMLYLPVGKWDAQGIGSALTYARRYSFSALVAVPSGESDDDGETAVGRGASLIPPPQPPQPPQPPVSVAVPSSEEANLPLDWDGPIPVVQGIPKPIFKVLGPRPSSPTAIHCEDCYGRISSLDQVMGGASPRVTLVLESGGLFVNLSMFGTWSYPAKKGDWIEVCGITKRGKYLNFKSIRAARAPEGFKEGSDPSDIPF